MENDPEDKGMFLMKAELSHLKSTNIHAAAKDACPILDKPNAILDADDICQAKLLEVTNGDEANKCKTTWPEMAN